MTARAPSAGRSQKSDNLTELITVRVPGAVKLTGISRSTLYTLIREKQIETVKVGRSRYVVVASLRRFIESLRE